MLHYQEGEVKPSQPRLVQCQGAPYQSSLLQIWYYVPTIPPSEQSIRTFSYSNIMQECRSTKSGTFQIPRITGTPYQSGLLKRGERREEKSGRRFNDFSRASQVLFSVNSREAIPIKPATNQVLCPRIPIFDVTLWFSRRPLIRHYKQQCSVSCNYQEVMQILPRTVLTIC